MNGAGSITLTTLNGGNLTVSAVYSGDGTYAPSTSPSAQFYIQPEPSALSVAIGGQPTIGGSYTVTVTDTATSGVGQPSGPSDGDDLGHKQQLHGGAGACDAQQRERDGYATGDDGGYDHADGDVYDLGELLLLQPPIRRPSTIAKATPTLSISYSPSPPVSGATIMLNAVVSAVGTAAAPTGAVTFFDNGTTLNAGQLDNGKTTTTGTVPTTATHSITATYAGDSNYTSVSTTAGSSSNGTIATTLVLVGSSTTVSANQSVTFTATLTPASTGPASPSGSVSFLDNGTQIGTANLVTGANGYSASFATSNLSTTTNHVITAVYSGDGYYSASLSNGVGVSGTSTSNATTTTLVVTANNSVHGQPVSFTATVSSTGGSAVPTGAVTFTSATTGILGQATLVNGVATYTTNQLPGGTSTITASYTGNTTYSASFSTAASVTITPEPVTLSILVPATATVWIFVHGSGYGDCDLRCFVSHRHHHRHSARHGLYVVLYRECDERRHHLCRLSVSDGWGRGRRHHQLYGDLHRGQELCRGRACDHHGYGGEGDLKRDAGDEPNHTGGGAVDDPDCEGGFCEFNRADRHGEVLYRHHVDRERAARRDGHGFIPDDFPGRQSGTHGGLLG